MKPNIYFISGIDTDAGKKLLHCLVCQAAIPERTARHHPEIHSNRQYRTPEDIDLHRRIMGTGYLPEDNEGLTMPEIFSLSLLSPSCGTHRQPSYRLRQNRERHAGACPPLRYRTRGRSRRTDGSP